MNFTIYRDNWRRGDDLHPEMGITRLLNIQGNMCCLGQIGRQCGVPRKALLNVSGPAHIAPNNNFYRELLLEARLTEDDDFFGQCMEVNDDPGISDDEREELLAKLFAANTEHTLTFVDGPYPTDGAAETVKGGKI